MGRMDEVMVQETHGGFCNSNLPNIIPNGGWTLTL